MNTVANTVLPRTTNEWACQFFHDALTAGKPVVSNVELQAYVQARTGQSRGVISGTLDGMGRDSLVESKWYLASWYKSKTDNGRIIHRRLQPGEDAVLMREEIHDFRNQQKACEAVMAYLPVEDSPRVLTLASVHGNSVQAAFARNPNVQVDTIEFCPDILRLWQERKRQLGLQTTDYKVRLDRFISTSNFGPYDLIDIDEKGYACEKMCGYLTVINRRQSCRILALTVQLLDGFRNGGPFADGLRRKWAGRSDPQAKCIQSWLPDYEMVHREEYNDGDRSKPMDLMVFQLNPETDTLKTRLRGE